MSKIQFGSADPIEALGYSVTDTQELFLTFDRSVTTFDALDKAIAAYGGVVKVLDDSGNVTDSLSGYDSEPSILSRYEGTTAIFQVNLKRVSTNDLDAVKTSITSLNSKASTMETSIEANTNSVASALEGVASLFEMVTGVSTDDSTTTTTSDTSATTSDSSTTATTTTTTEA